MGTSWTNLTANSNGRVSSFRDFDWGAKLPMYVQLALYILTVQELVQTLPLFVQLPALWPQVRGKEDAG